MKCKYNKSIGGNPLQFEIEGEIKEVFEELAQIDEIFSEKACGCCKANELGLRVREVDTDKYFEVYCRKCGAALSIGQNKKGGGLFPKRYFLEGDDPKNKKKIYDKVNAGWHRYDAKKKTDI